MAAVHVHLEVGERKQNSGTENPHGVLDRELKGFDINYISHSGKDRKEGLRASKACVFVLRVKTYMNRTGWS